MKRVFLPLLGAFVAMLVVAAVAGGHGSKGHRSLELVANQASFTFVDVDPKQANPDTEAPTPGDDSFSRKRSRRTARTSGTRTYSAPSSRRR